MGGSGRNHKTAAPPNSPAIKTVISTKLKTSAGGTKENVETVAKSDSAPAGAADALAGATNGSERRRDLMRLEASRRDIQWDSIASFDIAKPHDRQWQYRNGVGVFVKSQQPGDASTREFAISPTHFLSDRQLQRFLTVVRYYRIDLTLTPEQIRPPLSDKILPKRPKKPVLENGEKVKPRLRVALLAIMLGLAIPFGLIGLVVILSLFV